MEFSYLTGHGDNEVVAVGNRPLPRRAAGEVRVHLHAATLNRVDLSMRHSGVSITHRIPQSLSVDGAGVIDDVDADEPALRPGRCPRCAQAPRIRRAGRLNCAGIRLNVA